MFPTLFFLVEKRVKPFVKTEFIVSKKKKTSQSKAYTKPRKAAQEKKSFQWVYYGTMGISFILLMLMLWLSSSEILPIPLDAFENKVKHGEVNYIKVTPLSKGKRLLVIEIYNDGDKVIFGTEQSGSYWTKFKTKVIENLKKAKRPNIINEKDFSLYWWDLILQVIKYISMSLLTLFCFGTLYIYRDDWFIMAALFFSGISCTYMIWQISHKVDFRYLSHNLLVQRITKGEVGHIKTYDANNGIFEYKVTLKKPFVLHRKTVKVEKYRLTKYRYKGLIKLMNKHNVAYNSKIVEQDFLAMIKRVVPTLLITGFIIFFAFASFGNASSFTDKFDQYFMKNLEDKDSKITFADIGGSDHIKEDLQELIDMLRNPEDYKNTGIDIPAGYLFEGPPGTGKTFFGKAVAGEAGVTFMYISAAEINEVYVGTGAGRIRKLFRKAREVDGWCIIFIDEIDSIGKKRGTRNGSTNDDQIINQLLTEMDGFDGDQNVIVIAATNLADQLDDALTRPGRFDRRITFTKPDMHDRQEVAQVLMKKFKVIWAENISTKRLARLTPGFSQVEIENLLNEAVLRAVRRKHEEEKAQQEQDDAKEVESSEEVKTDRDSKEEKREAQSSEETASDEGVSEEEEKPQIHVELIDIEYARDKILMGPVRPLHMTEEDKKMTAVHEAGHALTAKLMPETNPIHKATIIPRGNALGMVSQYPVNDSVSMTYQQLISELVILLAGFAAEESVFEFNSITTGASSDLQKARDYALRMLTQWGMALRLDKPANGDTEDEESKVPGVDKRRFFHLVDYEKCSEEVRAAVDREVARLTEYAYHTAMELIMDQEPLFTAIWERLLAEGTLTGSQIDEMTEELYVEKAA